MNSKERVRAVLRGDLPDRVPWGEFAIDFDTVEKIIGHETYYRAKAKSQFALWEGRRDEVVQSWKEDAIELYRKLDSMDIITVSAMASSIAPPRGFTCEKPRKIDDNTWEYRSGKVIKYSSVTADLTTVYDPVVGTREYTLGDFEVEPSVEPPDESCFEVVDAIIEAFAGNRFIVGPAGHEIGIVLLGGSFEEGGGGFAHGLMQYYDNPETVRAAYRYEVVKNNKLDHHFIRSGQDGVFFAQQDFASTQGPFISPDMFREFALPSISERVRHVHEGFGLPVFKHCCGNTTALLDMFIEAGYDVYQSVQESSGLDIQSIQQQYGDRMVPWGGLSVERLVSGTRDDVKKGVHSAMERLKPGGRFIFGSSHSIAVGTKYDNFMTMVEEFEKLRDYPSGP